MSLGDRTKEHIERKVAGLYALAQNIGENLEQTAKSGATWTDRTGNTRRAIHGGADKSNRGATIYLAHGSKVGWYMEEGTGVHGPKGRPITAKNGGLLRFTVGGKTIFVKSVKGMKAQPIVQPTVKAALPDIKRQVRKYWGST
ncbi:hypothetical protein [Rummeliibacillus sp. POC4]|uniref:hypothetical protein n=1 Tax=Rummeliibacillus sp. POC4 TaxID=2305899 RepID=UPI000E674BE2|nr:hypothetical protein [Rummeliibacillus sp. POC4]RIJ63608.1 hypothetical protein D1606_14100 [Rummeliibacillus sp. POC4]